MEWSLPQEKTAGVIRITPKLASEMLESNPRNRRIRRNLVEYIKAQILNGEWQPDHPNPISFSKDRLIDGQHRLLAIVAAGVPVNAEVRYGVRDELRKYIDTGTSRTLDDQLEFVPDDKNTNKIVSELLNHWQVIGGRLSGIRRRLTPDEAWEEFKKHEMALCWAASRKPKMKIIGRAAIWAAMAEFFERHGPSAAEDFAEALIKDDAQVQQARMLKGWLYRAHASNNGRDRIEREEDYERTVYCLKAYSTGTEIFRVLRARWDDQSGGDK